MKHALSLAIVTIVSLTLLMPVASPKSSRDSLRDLIISKEREELDALKTGNREAFSSLLANDAVFLDPHGHGTKSEVLEHTADFRLLEYSMEDVRFVPLSASSGLIAYKLDQKGSSHGHEFSQTVYASALWVKRGDKWVCVFSQETPAQRQK